MNRDILHRMKSIRQTVQISSAQKLLAATQIGKARRLLAQSQPYHNTVSRAFATAMLHCPEGGSRYVETDPPRHGQRRGLLVFSASKGLAGGYNGNVVRFVEASLAERPACYIIALGKARDTLLQKGCPVDPGYYQPLDPPTVFAARELAEKVVDMMERGIVDSFDVVYTAYRSPVRLEPVQRRLFPLNPALFASEVISDGVEHDFIFEPNPERVIASIALKYLKGYLYGSLVHAWICELTSRLMAMDNAIRNGNDIIARLSLAYNRQRQSAITQEITEIVAGSAAMTKEE